MIEELPVPDVVVDARAVVSIPLATAETDAVGDRIAPEDMMDLALNAQIVWSHDPEEAAQMRKADAAITAAMQRTFARMFEDMKRRILVGLSLPSALPTMPPGHDWKVDRPTVSDNGRLVF